MLTHFKHKLFVILLLKWSSNQDLANAKSLNKRLKQLHWLYHKFSYLFFLEPLLDELFAALLYDGATQLEGLVLVELALVQQDTEVLQEGRGLAGLGGHLLELLDGGRRTQDALHNNTIKLIIV